MVDIGISASINPAAIHSCKYKCIDAILDSEDLAYKFPDTAKELDEAAQGFALLSSHSEIKGCDACLEDFLLQMAFKH